MITLQTADSALKNMYLGVLSEQLNINSNPLWAKLERTSENVVGKEVHRVVTNGFNGGIGAGTESGNLPSAIGNNYTLLKSGLKNIYGKIEITDKALRASQNNEGAFVNLLDAEMQGLLNAGKFHLSRMLYGKGDGYLATVVSCSADSDEYTLDDLSNIMVGMTVDVYMENSFVEGYANATVVDWDIATKKVKLSLSADDDMEIANVLTLVAHNGNNGELTGLGAIFDTVNFPTLYGVNRANVGWLKPLQMSVTSATFSEAKILEIFDELSTNAQSEADFVVMGYELRRKYQELLATNRMNTDILKLDGGYTAMSFNGVPIIADRFIQGKKGYFLNTKLLKLHELCDWEWLTNDKGQILHQREGYPTHSASLVKYCELICDKPSGLASISYN